MLVLASVATSRLVYCPCMKNPSGKPGNYREGSFRKHSFYFTSCFMRNASSFYYAFLAKNDEFLLHFYYAIVLHLEDSAFISL